MKKLIALSSAIASFIAPKVAFAEPPKEPTNITITKPGEGFGDLGNFVNNLLTLAFGVALLVVLFMLVWGAFDWITSGGDKEAVGKARSKIINALIGMAVLAVAFALAKVAADFVGINIFNLEVPKPSPTS